ncbi:methylated-DNA--[protein]-cysteine S-methyltransferase [Salinivibrio kushneri]|uniref:methylated-DNA--[protein]-cysteine S-methyltransferase n=1 Tax=Salinivibrio kushneri TaxID=1908198 RepID=UPI000F0A8F32|nr:MGMT family protein [Salinivibrio kushneri]
MNTINIQYYKHPYAEFILGSYQGKLCLCDFRYRKMRSAVDDRIKRILNAEFVEKSDDILVATQAQLEEYFFGERQVFDLPLLLAGTDFQQSVWNALSNIQYGDRATYQELAVSIGVVS